MRPAALAFLFMLVAVQTVACSPADVLKAQLRASDDNIVGKTFHSLILAPVSDARLAALHPSQLSFETPVHPADLVAAFLDYYRSLDGQDYNFDSIVHSHEARQMTRSRLLDFTVRTMTDRPLSFRRRGSNAILLPHRSIESCIRAAEFGLVYKLKEGSPKSYQIDFEGETTTLEEAEFTSKVLPFLQEACSLIEFAKNQVRPNEQSAGVFEFKSLKLLLESPLGLKAKAILTSVIAKVGPNYTVRLYPQGLLRKESSLDAHRDIRRS